MAVRTWESRLRAKLGKATPETAGRVEARNCRLLSAEGIGVMDLAAFSLCSDNRIPIVVCQLFEPGNLVKAVCGEPVGTLVTE